MNDETKIVEIVQARTEDGKIPCEEVFKIAKELDLSTLELGRILNENKIKVVHCQLGCFP